MGLLGTLGIGIFVIIFIITALLIYLFRRIYSEKDDPRNEDWVINGLSAYCGGHAMGIIKSEESNKNLVKIVFSPRDIDYLKLKDKEYKVIDRTIFVKKKNLIPFNISNHRKMKIALPDRKEDLSDDFIKNNLGNKFGECIEQTNKESEDQYIKNTQERNMMIIRKKVEGLEISKEGLELYGEATKDIVKNRNLETPKKNE